MKRRSARSGAAAFAAGALCLSAQLAASSAFAATVQLVNLDPAGVGFNDPTPAPPAPNNSGGTVGEQKLAVVQWAANRLGQLLYSPVPIVIEVAHDETLFCDANAATLAAAGPAWLLRRQGLIADHPDLPTWYPAALGQRLLGTTLFAQDVGAQINPDLGAADCLDGFQWYFGLDGDAPVGTTPFVDTILHELTHGVGFTALVGADGVVSALDPTAISPYFAYAYDTAEQQFWWQMSAAERAISATAGLLVWAGPRTTLAAGALLSAGVDGSDRPYLYAPAQFDESNSLSHFDPSATPDLLMEPFGSSQLDVFSDDIDLGLEFLQDLGWRDAGCGNGIVDTGEECDLGAGNDAGADAIDECTLQCLWFEDGCPLDPMKTTPGACGCGVPETDSDGDQVVDCLDACPADPNKTSGGTCGCGAPDVDSDNDGSANCVDGCDNDGDKTAAGECGCGVPDTDDDADSAPNCLDACPADPNKVLPGICGCGAPDVDSDNDGSANCVDGCPLDAAKVAPGECGCGVLDAEHDGGLDCQAVAPVCDGDAGVCVLCTTNADCGSNRACDALGVCSSDRDGDGVADDADLDADNDGITDSDEGDTDLDADGLPNQLDRDADADGIADVVEAGGTDDNDNGVWDGFEGGDSDGLTDASVVVETTWLDSDADDTPDFLDMDSDADGILDAVEASDADYDGVADQPALGIDADSDGWDAAFDASEGGTVAPLPDQDDDGVPDYQDPAADVSEPELDSGVTASPTSASDAAVPVETSDAAASPTDTASSEPDSAAAETEQAPTSSSEETEPVATDDEPSVSRDASAAPPLAPSVDAGASDAGTGGDESDDGCDCRVVGGRTQSAPSALWLLAVAGAVLRRRLGAPSAGARRWR